MAWRGLRPHKQRKHGVLTSALGLQDWETCLHLPGTEGGQSMRVLWRGPEHALPSVWMLGAALLQPLDEAQYRAEECSRPAAARAEWDFAHAEELALHDFVYTVNRAHARTKGHSVLPWSAPRCAWRVALIHMGDR